MKKTPDIVILAAGNGTRMGNFTRYLPKPMISLNNVPIIDYILKKLMYLDIQRIIFVVGYQRDTLITYLKENYYEKAELAFIINSQIDRENGYSLLCAKDSIKSDRFLLLMADHVVDFEIYKNVSDLAEIGEIILATSSFSGLNDSDEATKVLLKENQILKIGKNLELYSAYDTGVFAMSKKVFPILERLCQQQYQVSISDLVNRCIQSNLKVFSCDVTGYFWMDIDTERDMEMISHQRKRQNISLHEMS